MSDGECNQNLRQVVEQAARRDDVAEAVGRVYAQLQAEIDARKPLCTASGRCCRFEQFGHRLYVTTLELAAFTRSLEFGRSLEIESNPSLPRGAIEDPSNNAAGLIENSSNSPTRKGGVTSKVEVPSKVEFTSKHEVPSDLAGCPYQIDGLCSVHAIRPFGCRVFFCDSTSDEWQHAQYERFHAELKRLHEEFDVPYRYVEWRQALRELGLANRSARVPNPLSLPQLEL